MEGDKVVVEGTESNWEDLPRSVLQGTVLGGIFFTLYMNDIVVSAFLRQFVDSTKNANILRDSIKTHHFFFILFLLFRQ